MFGNIKKNFKNVKKDNDKNLKRRPNKRFTSMTIASIYCANPRRNGQAKFGVGVLFKCHNHMRMPTI